MRRLLLFTVLVLLVGTNDVSARKKQANLTVFSEVSLGHTEKKVVATLSKALEIVEDMGVDMTDVCRYQYLLDMLAPGLDYDSATMRYTASREVVKKYVVKDCTPLWPERFRVEFYFMSPYGTDNPFTLFGIRATMKYEIDEVWSVFQKYAHIGTNERKGKEPLVLNTSYFNRDSSVVLTKMAIWEMTTSTRDYLFVPDNGTIIFPEFFQEHKGDLAKMVNSLQMYKAAREAEK
jgi:hypothetical protein